jgi:hypothetical protein
MCNIYESDNPDEFTSGDYLYARHFNLNIKGHRGNGCSSAATLLPTGKFNP